MRYAFFLVLGVAFLAIGCQTSEPMPGDPQVGDPTEMAVPADTLNPELLVDDVGTVEFQDIEGGFYGIVADDGSRYNPKELDEEFQEDGLRVRFRGYIDEEAMTVQMWGKSLDLMEIMALDVDY